MVEISEHLQGILSTLPLKPGCYIYRNTEGTVIYVGKAVNLRNRVRSYFHSSPDQDFKTRQLVQRIADIEWIGRLGAGSADPGDDLIKSTGRATTSGSRMTSATRTSKYTGLTHSPR